MNTTTIDLKVKYFGTPVVLISTLNQDGTPNLAPMSSAWWLGDNCMLGLGNAAQTAANLRRTGECVLNLASAEMVDAVDRLALTTGRREVPPYKAKMGYVHEPDKFAVAGLTAISSEKIATPRAAECPIQLESVLVDHTPFGGPRGSATAFEVRVVRSHVAEDLVIPGTQYVDPVGWDPLIMKFCEFFGGGENVYPSRLADGWQMPHDGRRIPA